MGGGFKNKPCTVNRQSKRKLEKKLNLTERGATQIQENMKSRIRERW